MTDEQVQKSVANMSSSDLAIVALNHIYQRLERIEQHLGLVEKPEHDKQVLNTEQYCGTGHNP